MFNDDKIDEPRHLSTGKCLCQFIEEHFKSTDDHDDDDEEFNNIECDDEGDSPNEDDCCSIGEITDMVDGKHTKINSVENCVQIDINKLVADATNDSLRITILIGGDQDQPSNRSQLPKQVTSNNNAMSGASSYYNTMDSFVPTLSQLVSMKECSSADLERQTDSTSPVNTEFSFDTTTVGTSDCLVDQSLIRNDDLINKLRDLLEMRKNELSTLGQRSSHNVALGASQQQQQSASNGRTRWNTQDRNLTKNSAINNKDRGSEGGTNNLKKFFSQTTDGFSFLSAGKHKQHQRGFYVKRQQALEIC